MDTENSGHSVKTEPIITTARAIKILILLVVLYILVAVVYPKFEERLKKEEKTEKQSAGQTIPTITLNCAKTPDVFDGEDSRLPHLKEVAVIVPPADCWTWWIGRPRDGNGVFSRRFWFDHKEPIEVEFYRENKTITSLGAVGPFDEIRISSKPKLAAARFRNASEHAVTLTAYLR